ncbi:uncharacterized protein KY384_007211 [Bacidia gigantensis]|uniref:uncharacterized protein n=1 Tax=Bacidia gigantensis TaxID=2732470 RepID=UPI001D0446E7|nr:uncharacterized protein KY384_007211 [Bacidia gigantensis]KAG8528294.1 hypothetical protein KY384_007211 [Bacidia gigantensis]
MASQYRPQYPQQRVPQPQLGPARRPQGPGGHMPHAAYQQSEAARIENERRQIDIMTKAKEEEEALKRRAMRPTDKKMPDGVNKLIVGDGVTQYKQLRGVERKLDSVMMRKRLDFEDAKSGQGISSVGGANYPGLSRGRDTTLRVWISNTVENQPWQNSAMEDNAFDFTMGSEATYRVRIEGKVVNESNDEEPESDDDSDNERRNDDTMDTAAEGEKDGESASKSKAERPRLEESEKKTMLSHFFKSITIDFDRDPNQQPDQMTQIAWKNEGSQSSVKDNFDSLEFERKSDENINCTINFYRDEQQWSERHSLSKPLSDLLDTTEDDRTSIMMGIWEYVKVNGLQQDEEKRQIHCDEKMRAVFGRDIIYFPHIPTLLENHLSPLSPLSVPYTVRVDPEYHSLPSEKRYTIYTFQIPTAAIPPSVPNPDVEDLKSLKRMDDHLALLIQAIGKSQRKHSFLSQLSRDPVTFTQRWMSSQRRDLEVALGESGRFEDPANLGGVWSQGGHDGVWGKQEVKEAVGVMVQKPEKAGRTF